MFIILIKAENFPLKQKKSALVTNHFMVKLKVGAGTKNCFLEIKFALSDNDC